MVLVDPTDGSQITVLDIGMVVHFDGCDSIKATVTGVLIEGRPGRENIQYRLSYTSNGATQAPWVEAFRISGRAD